MSGGLLLRPSGTKENQWRPGAKGLVNRGVAAQVEDQFGKALGSDATARIRLEIGIWRG